MLKRAAAVGTLFALCLLLPALNAQARSVFWQRWDVRIENVDTASNRFDVTETHDVHFSGTFSFGSRVISRVNTSDIINIRIYEDERALQPGCAQAPGTFCVTESGDGLSIRYHFFQPITDSSRVFRISYTVIGALRVYESGDQLWWTVIPSEHYGFSIGSSTVVVQMPDNFGPREGIDPVVTYGAPATITVEGATVRAVTTRTVRGDERLEIRVQYPHDPAARPAAWQASYDERAAFETNVKPLLDVGVLALSLLVGVGGLLGVFTLWHTRGRDPDVGPVPDYISEPPSDLRPAAAGTLIDEHADTRDVLSIILDLADRGYLVIEENRSSDIFGIWKSRKFVFKRTDKSSESLRSFERLVMQTLFPGLKRECSLEALKNHFYKIIPDVQRSLYEELVSAGFFRLSPNWVRSGWAAAGTALGGLVLIATVLVWQSSPLFQASPAFVCLPAALIAVAAALVVVSRSMPAKTRAGAEESAKWQAFRRYLANLEKYRDVETAADQFARFLPYAVAFDLDRSWVQKFRAVENVPVPHWYYPAYVGGRFSRGFTAGAPLPESGYGDLARASGDVSLDTVSSGLASGLNSISDGLTAMLSSASQIIVSRPASSGSGGSWSSGGSSWSGGGFSGGSSGGGSAGFG